MDCWSFAMPVSPCGRSVFLIGLTIYCVTMTPATTLSIILREPRGTPGLAHMPMVAPGDGEVLLRIEACGLCHSDLFVCGLARLPVAPLRLGHEGIGRIEALGEG